MQTIRCCFVSNQAHAIFRVRHGRFTSRGARIYRGLALIGRVYYVSFRITLGGTGSDELGKALSLHLLLQGTLDLLILKAISLGPLHGYGILLRIQQISGDRLEIQQGSFYPAIYRLEHQEWIEGEWGESENNRKAKFYRLTATGRRQLRAETHQWAKMTNVVGDILTATPEEL
jgi:PadR family transcriptional regulator, regulatory protein PadR